MFMLMMFFFISMMMIIIMSCLLFILSFKMSIDREFKSSFECGFSSTDESRMPFSLRFFMIALIFLIFDIELLFLFPYVSISMLNFSVFSSKMMIIFLFILSLGLFYEWNMSMLSWNMN